MTIHGLSQNDGGGSAAPAAPKQELGKDAFLNLLVAQIKNQDPLNPSDGVQFLSQLAQFSELEQLIAMREDLAALRAQADSAAVPAGGETT
jgi:flagellar basal-body rod modification protein FlgD